MGKKTIMVNYNPETVSTDYDESDRLYFEELSLERILDISDKEQQDGTIVSVGGQIPNTIALDLHKSGLNILGTHPDQIDQAEVRRSSLYLHAFVSGLLLDWCPVLLPSLIMCFCPQDRDKYSSLMNEIGVDQPAWCALDSVEAATEFCRGVGFPVLVRPSYVLSGAAMNVVFDEDDLARWVHFPLVFFSGPLCGASPFHSCCSACY
jgi:carbamoylphosphate synthase large subunit